MFAGLFESLTDRSGEGGEVLLFTAVLIPAGFSFNGDGVESELTQVIGAGAHVQGASEDGEFKSVGHQVAADPWPEFASPLVEIHVGVEASGLFVLMTGFEGWLEGIERDGRGREKTEGVVVGAAERLGFDEIGNVPGGQAKRMLIVSDLALALAVNHGPLVQSVAAEACGFGKDVVAQRGNPTGLMQVAWFRIGPAMEPMGSARFWIGRKLVALLHAGNPGEQFVGGEVVVGEEEIPDRMFVSMGAALNKSLGMSGDAGAMDLFTLQPDFFSEAEVEVLGCLNGVDGHWRGDNLAQKEN